MTVKRYFAFIPGTRDPEGQIYEDYLPTTGEGKKKVNYLFGPIEIQNETLDECLTKFKDKVSS